MTHYLQKKLPINSSLLQDLRCLHPLFKDKTWTVNCIGRLAEAMLHIIDPVQVSQIKDEWKALQAEAIPPKWAEGCVDHITMLKSLISKILFVQPNTTFFRN